MVVFLTFVGILAGLVSLQNNGAAMALYNSTTSHQFSLPYDDGNQVPDEYDSIRTVLAGAAYKLGVTADEMNEAYDEAQCSIIPFSAQTEISQDGQARAPEVSSDDMPGYLATVFDIMARNLGIPAKDILAAWQSTIEEFRQFDSNDSQENAGEF